MTSHDNTELDLVGCPKCGALAEVVDRFMLPSTGGPVEHVKVRCASRRWFTTAVDHLPAVVREELDRWTFRPRPAGSPRRSDRATAPAGTGQPVLARLTPTGQRELLAS